MLKRIIYMLISRKSAPSGVIAEAPPHVSEFRRVARVMFGRWIVILGAVIILLLIVCAIFAPFIAPYDPLEVNLKEALQLPSSEHLLGTDSVGRDTLSRTIYGTRVSLQIAIFSVGLAALAGITLGLIAGYFGGIIDSIIMRCIDTLMAIPALILALTFAAMLGGGLRNIVLALTIAMMPEYARLMAGQTRHIKQNDYVLASRITGSSNIRIMSNHVLRNCFPPLMVMITLNLGLAIMAESALSFLGIGVEPPIAAWGGMVATGYTYLTTHPVLSLAPGVAILLVVLSFNLVGDGLRDAVDPRLRGVI